MPGRSALPPLFHASHATKPHRRPRPQASPPATPPSLTAGLAPIQADHSPPPRPERRLPLPPERRSPLRPNAGSLPHQRDSQAVLHLHLRLLGGREDVDVGRIWLWNHLACWILGWRVRPGEGLALGSDERWGDERWRDGRWGVTSAGGDGRRGGGSGACGGRCRGASV